MKALRNVPSRLGCVPSFHNWLPASRASFQAQTRGKSQAFFKAPPQLFLVSQVVDPCALCGRETCCQKAEKRPQLSSTSSRQGSLSGATGSSSRLSVARAVLTERPGPGFQKHRGLSKSVWIRQQNSPSAIS